MALNTVVLKWDLTDLIQAGLSATLSITPTAQLSDTTDHVLIPAVTRRVNFTGGTGQLAGIVANDNASILPAYAPPSLPGAGYLISVATADGVAIVPQFQTQVLFANGATQWLDALAVVPVIATGYQFLPLPSGTALSGEVPVATGTGEASAWTTLTAASVGAASTGALTSEAATRANADTTLSTAIGNEVSRAEGAESTLGTAISAETTRAETAEGLLVPLAQKGANSGVATLDSGGHVPAGQLANALLLAGGTMTGPVINFEDKGGQVFNVKAYGAVGNAITYADGAMTASGATLTSASAAFSGADVGKQIVVQGAGAAGASLGTTISAVANSTTVTLAAAASTTVSGATYYYGTDDSAAFASCAADVIAARGLLPGGGTGYVPPGYYIAAGIPLESALFWAGAGFDASRIYLTSSGSSSMFTAVSGNLKSGAIRDLGLYGDGTPTAVQANTGGSIFVNISSTSTRRCVDLSAAGACQQFFIQDNFIRDFGYGYYGSQNDRFIPFHGNRVWNCLYGAYLLSNHPNFGIGEFRYCGTGVSDGGHLEVDLQFIGTKFPYNNTGVDLSTASGARIAFVGCHFFGNISTGAKVADQASFSGCLFDGWAGGTTYLLYITGNRCAVTGNIFAGGHLTAAVYFNNGSAGAVGLTVTGNEFEADAVSAGASGLIVIGSTGWLYQPVISDNVFYLQADQPVLYSPSGPNLVHPVIEGNQVVYDNATPGAQTLFTMASTSGGGYIFSGNTVYGKGSATGPVLSAAKSTASVIAENRFRNVNATVLTLGTTDAGTRVFANYGYAGGESYAQVADNLSDLASASAAFANISPLTTKGDLLYEDGTPAPARLPVGSGGQVLGVSSGVPAWGTGMTLLVTTGNSGTALVNGTPTILSWTAPNDGNMHRVMVFGSLFVSSAETGGQVNLTYGLQGASAAHTSTWVAGGQSSSAAGVNPSVIGLFLLAPGTTISVVQGTALTVGAATIYAEIWGS